MQAALQVNRYGQYMWSEHVVRTTVVLDHVRLSNRVFVMCAHMCVCVIFWLCVLSLPPLPSCQQLYAFMCTFKAVCPFVFVHVCMFTWSMFPGGLGWIHGQVRDVGGTGRFLEQPRLSVTLDCRCVCLNTSVCQLSSACRGTGVYSSSLLLLGLTCFPVAPGPANQARHGTGRIQTPHDSGLVTQLLLLFKN